MDPPEYEWFYDVGANAIMVTTTTVVHIYFQLGRMHKVVEPNVLLAPAVIPEAPPTQPLAPWDFSLYPLLDIEIEPISPGLPSVEILPQLAISIIELSSTTTLVLMAASPLILEYHPDANPIYEKDPLKETSTVVSRAVDVTGPSRAHRVEVLSRNPYIICTAFVP